MNIFDQPLLGPFVEGNGLTDGANTGATVTWTSVGNVYRLDLVRLQTHSIWRESLGFAQAPDLGFEEFLWHSFEHNHRLPEFLNEIMPFIRPSGGAPSPAQAGQWLNPALVAKGFSLGIAKVRNGQIIRVPVIWVFGGAVEAYGSRSQYSRIDFIDWTPSETKLLQHYYYWGTGAKSLRRLLHQSVDSLNEPLLTEAGQARMCQLLSWSRPKAPATKRIPFTPSESATALRLRQSLHDLPDPLPAKLKDEVSSISERAYAGLLRACVERDLPDSARILLFHRPLPVTGRQKLLERFVDAQWLKIWDVCAREAFSELPQSRYGYDALLHRVMETGSKALLQAVLDSISSIGKLVVQYLLEEAFKKNRADLFNAILDSRLVQPIRNECLLGCFRDCLFDYRQSQQLALYLLEIGVRPIQSIQPDEILQPCHWLLEDYNFSVLKRTLELEPPTHESLLKLLGCGHLRPGEVFNYLKSVSRQLPLHQERMNRVACRAATSFIYGGEKESITLLDQSFQEGANIKDIAFNFEKNEPLTGYKWKEREGNWIDLIGHLIKSGRPEDAEAIKKLKRPRRKKSS
jgi:hypothetical protein